MKMPLTEGEKSSIEHTSGYNEACRPAGKRKIHLGGV